MKYVLLANSLVSEILPLEDPLFPGVPIKDRYSAEFLSACIEVPKSTVVTTGDFYDEGTGIFSTPEPPEPSEPSEPLPETPYIPSSTYGERVQFLEGCIAELATQIYI